MSSNADANLAKYAVRATDGGQREHAEPPDPLRDPFELDCHRIIESTAFRRLEHKTQVFAPGMGDHFRTRLTHTLEVAEIATTLARALRANARLARAIALAHDLGHPPFGHAGEAALNELMTQHGGFNHNLHSLRVVEYLEHPFPRFRGLNLTDATRAGMRAHATPYDKPEAPRAAGFNPRGDRTSEASPADAGTGEAPRAAGFSPRGAATGDADDEPAPAEALVEAQIADLADRIAYNCHDLEDATGAGMLTLAELREVALWRSTEEYARQTFGPGPDNVHAIRRPALDALLNRLVGDVVGASLPRLEALLPQMAALDNSVGAGASDAAEASALVEGTGGPLVHFSPARAAELADLEAFLLTRVYRHAEIAATDARGREMIRDLFGAYRENACALPERFQARIGEQGLDHVICDYVAGMTDRFCHAEHERLV